MSDEEENEQHHFHLPFQIMTPEQAAAHAEAMRANAEANGHEIERFIESLGEEQLIAFRRVVQVTSDNIAAGSYYIGLAGGELKHRFGVCLACGKKHDEMLEEMVARPMPAPAQPDEDHAPFPTEPSDIEALMEKYGLVWEERKGLPTRIVCSNCGMEYQSVEDRMIEPPGVEGCDGCKQKSKFG